MANIKTALAEPKVKGPRVTALNSKPAKTSKPKKSSQSKSAAASKTKSTSHPSFIEMIKEAVAALNNRKGSSRVAITSHLKQHHDLGDKNVNLHVNKALKKGLTSGVLQLTKGTGANGSYRLGNGTITKPTKPAAPAGTSSKSTAVAKAPVKPKPTVAKTPAKPKPTVAKSPAKPKPTAAKAPAKSKPTATKITAKPKASVQPKSPATAKSPVSKPKKLINKAPVKKSSKAPVKKAKVVAKKA